MRSPCSWTKCYEIKDLSCQWCLWRAESVQSGCIHHEARSLRKNSVIQPSSCCTCALSSLLETSCGIYTRLNFSTCSLEVSLLCASMLPQCEPKCSSNTAQLRLHACTVWGWRSVDAPLIDHSKVAVIAKTRIFRFEPESMQIHALHKKCPFVHPAHDVLPSCTSGFGNPIQEDASYPAVTPGGSGQTHARRLQLNTAMVSQSISRVCVHVQTQAVKTSATFEQIRHIWYQEEA
jgi:hypothetical protein